jgi:ferredoxin-2, mitochondrial
MQKLIKFTSSNILNKTSQSKIQNFTKISKINFSSTKEDRKLGDIVKFKFIYLGDKKEVDVEAQEGQHILEIAHKYDVELEGACDASLACSTCHVILEKDIYEALPAASEEEEDLLDLAYGLTETSRLGCQTIINKQFEGTKVYIPSATRNLYVDGKKPAKH